MDREPPWRESDATTVRATPIADPTFAWSEESDCHRVAATADPATPTWEVAVAREAAAPLPRRVRLVAPVVGAFEETTAHREGASTEKTRVSEPELPAALPTDAETPRGREEEADTLTTREVTDTQTEEPEGEAPSVQRQVAPLVPAIRPPNTVTDTEPVLAAMLVREPLFKRVGMLWERSCEREPPERILAAVREAEPAQTAANKEPAPTTLAEREESEVQTVEEDADGAAMRARDEAAPAF